MRALRFLIFVLLSFVTAAFFSGCRDDPRSHNPGDGGGGSTTTGDPGTGGDILETTGGAGGGPACDGSCVEWKSAKFEDLSMFWIGPPAEAPPCPDLAPIEGMIAYTDLVAPHTCPACSCSPAACVLPEAMRLSAAICPGDGAPSLAWDSPAWDGSCSAEGAIPPGLTCGGQLCAQSLTMAGPYLEPCQAVTEGAEDKPEPFWGQVARECIIGPLDSEGCDAGKACIHHAPPEGFSLCLYRHGGDLTAEDCPSTYPRHLVVYEDAEVEDERACEPCSCSTRGGSACSALVSVFSDAGCGALVAAATVGLDDPACVDLPVAGVGLGSKSAVLTVDEPGSCTASGGPTGALHATGPVTLCCQPAPIPPE